VTIGARLRASSLSSRILVGLVAGIATGLFVGERAAALQIFADAYIKLLQMTVLPYVTVSIITGLGALSYEQAKSLGVRVGAVLLLLWAVALVAVLLFPLMFPTLQTASFFSTTLVEPREPFDLVSLYIPSNPFNSLANNIVPAVVLFSIVIGVSLVAVPEKARLLEVLGVIGTAVSKATRYIVELTPYGIFAIGAVAAGTLSVEELQRLEVYLVSYVGISLLLSLWVLPGLVAALTPVPYGAVLSRTKDALITAFMTSSLFVVLPMLTEQTKGLLNEYAGLRDEDAGVPEVIVPASFNFPHTGKLLSLSFVLFAGWYADASLAVTDYPRLAAMGVLTLFGNINVAIPFLLDMFRIPADTFQLFVATAVVNARFGTLMSAVHTLTMALLGTCAVIGVLRIDRRKLVRFCVITAVLTFVVVGGTRLLFGVALKTEYDKDKVLAGMQALRKRWPATVYKPGDPPPPLPVFNGSVLDRVRTRKTLRVAYVPDSLPYVYFNTHGDLVGFDVEMAQQLAQDLNVALEFVPIARPATEESIDPSVCDLVMTGAAVVADRAMQFLYSTPYLDETLAFITLDHRRAEFSSWDDIRAMKTLRVAVPAAPYYIAKIRAELPNAEIVPVPLQDVSKILAHQDSTIDAFVLTAERGSAFTLLHPEFSVAVPKPNVYKVPLAYIVAGRDQPLVGVVNTWIDLKRKDGTIDELFAHWILGRDALAHVRRWSILDDVLGWGK